MNITKKAQEFKSLTKVVKVTDLENIYLRSCNVWRSLDAFKVGKVEANIEFDGDLLETSKTDLYAKVDFLIEGIDEERKDENTVVKIECEYVLYYVIKDKIGITKKDLRIFCNMNAVYNAWPYCREIVQNMTNRMEIPSLVLPLLKFRVPKKKTVGREKEK